MAKKTVLQWTDKQRAIADLSKQGKSPKDIIAAGYKKSLVFKVLKAVKDGQESSEDSTIKESPGIASNSAESPYGVHTNPVYETSIKTRSLEPVDIGALQILPEDWRINQYGAFLILETFNQAKRLFGYSGTLGEFICDVTQLFRKLMSLDVKPFYYLTEEDNDNRGKETNQGGGFPETGGQEADRGSKSGAVVR